VEREIARLEADLADPDVHRQPARIRQVQQEYQAAQEELATLMEHWEEALELN
jgi:protein subunit release factor A